MFAVVAGLVGGLAAVVLAVLVDASEEAFSHFRYLVCLLPVAGLVTVWLYRRLGVDAATSTVTVIDAARHNRPVGIRLAPAIVLGTCLTVLTGGSAGKEAPALQMGASLGIRIGKALGFAGDFDRFFVLSGMAAALSSLLHAPLASAVFVIEVSRLRLGQMRYYFPIAVASFSAYGVSELFAIDSFTRSLPVPTWDMMLFGTALAVIVACFGAVFCVCLRWVRRESWNLPHAPLISVAISGCIVSVLMLALGLEDFGGTGLRLIDSAFGGQSGAFDFLWKAFFTVLVLGTGFKGGEIMPSFAIGALLGSTLATLAGYPTGVGAAMGLVVMFGVISNCPLATIILGCEFYGASYLPLFIIASIVAYVFTHRVSLFDNAEKLGQGIDWGIHGVSRK